jgi:hypothetical protein
MSRFPLRGYSTVGAATGYVVEIESASSLSHASAGFNVDRVAQGKVSL